MAVKQFYHDIDLVNVGQLIGARYQNVTSVEQDALALTLGAVNKGLVVYNTDLSRAFIWNGSAFVQQEVTIDGDIVFKGVIADPATPNLEMIVGYQYAVGADGTLVQDGVTFIPSAVVNAGDQVLVTSATEAYVINRNIDDARIDAIEAKNIEQDGRLDVVEADIDAVELRVDAIEAEQIVQNNRLDAAELRLDTVEAEVDALELRVDAVEAKNIEQDLRLDAVEAKDIEQDGRLDELEANQVKTFFTTVNVPGLSAPLTIPHNLALANKDGFVLNTMLGGSQISLDVDSVDVNSITVRSLVPLTDVAVTVIGL